MRAETSYLPVVDKLLCGLVAFFLLCVICVWALSDFSHTSQPADEENPQPPHYLRLDEAHRLLFWEAARKIRAGDSEQYVRQLLGEPTDDRHVHTPKTGEDHPYHQMDWILQLADGASVEAPVEERVDVYLDEQDQRVTHIDTSRSR